MTKTAPAEELGLSECIKEAIRGSGRSLTRLGKAAGVGSNQLSRFMRGRQTLTLPAAERLCLALGLKLVSEGPPSGAEGHK